MELQELIAAIDHVDQGGPGTKGPNGENSAQLFHQGVTVPGAAREFVDRYSSSKNDITVSNLAASLLDLADAPAPDTVNLVYSMIERMSHWDDSWSMNNTLLVIRTQTINGMAWDPPDSTPSALGKFLAHCVALEPDDENDNSDTATNVLWVIHQWAEDRGGLRSVFNAEERQAFRDTFDEVGLEPGPILEALGEG